jgi:uncharacterized OB-fold protein
VDDKLTPEPYAKPIPDIEEPLAAPFWEGCRAGELRLQQCAQCGAYHLPPRPMCGECRSTDLRWVAASGRGRLWSWTVIHPPVLPAFAKDVPYNVAVVQLEEGLRVVSNVVGAGADDLRADAPVQVIFEEISPTVTLPKFSLVGPETR